MAENVNPAVIQDQEEVKVQAGRARAALPAGGVLVNREGDQFTRHTVSFHAPDPVDAGLLAYVARRHESQAGRRLVLMARVPDRPGSLARLLALVAGRGANLLDVQHIREGIDLHVRESAVQLVLETRAPEHAEQVAQAVREAGYAEPGVVG